MHDVVIIGGGPAGLTAALYASRRALDTIVLTKDIGGQAAKTLDIENYPGCKGKISGIELTANFKAQAESFGAKIVFEETKSIEKIDNYFIVKTKNNNYETKTVLLAFGKTPKELSIPGEEEYKGKGVSYCATCDGPFFRNKAVAVVGGGNSALDAALYLSKICQKVYLIHRRSTFAAEEVLKNKIEETENIETVMEDEVAEIKGEAVVNSISLKSGKVLQVNGIFVEVGFVVDRTLVQDLVDLNEKNQIIIDHLQNTSVSGIFAAGDLTTTPYKQIIVSAAEGAKAALSCFDYIQKQDGKRGILADWH